MVQNHFKKVEKLETLGCVIATFSLNLQYIIL